MIIHFVDVSINTSINQLINTSINQLINTSILCFIIIHTILDDLMTTSLLTPCRDDNIITNTPLLHQHPPPPSLPLLLIITQVREANWIHWKEASCPKFEKPAVTVALVSPQGTRLPPPPHTSPHTHTPPPPPHTSPPHTRTHTSHLTTHHTTHTHTHPTHPFTLFENIMTS